MGKKCSRTDDHDIPSYRDEFRRPRRAKREHSKTKNIVNAAHRSMLERRNRSVVDQGLIYAERLEANTARILVLHPGSTDDDIKCDLRQKEDLSQASIGKVLPYEAVSYVWGDEDSLDDITLCESRFAVTRNLAEALKYLRHPNSDRMLWVDAICINQYDKEEKEVQVKSMHWIYKFAKEVIAWLGPPDDASRLAFRIMKKMHKVHMLPVSAVITSRISNEKNAEEDDPVKKLMGRSYWSRAWVVQEMMSAKFLVIQCGSDVVPYSRLEELHPANKPALIEISSEKNKTERIDFRGDSEVKILRISSERICAKQFLDCFLDRQCRERHDNIFAFLNLLSDGIKRKIPVHYKTDIRKLVRITARAIIKSTHSLHIIVIRGRQSPPSARESEKWQLDMPSWCPYLATPYECCAIGPQMTPNLFAEKAVFSFVKNRVRVRGFIIGKIFQTISRKSPHKLEATASWSEEDVQRERKHYWKCLSLGLHGMPKDKHTVLTSIEATTRTLLAGRDDGISDVQALLEGGRGHEVHPERIALRKIWNNGKSRIVCSFRLGHVANRALESSKAAPAAWINCIALVPRTVGQGDIICTILGCTTPVVLRKAGEHYRVLGEAYVDTSAMGRFRVAVALRNFELE